MRTLQAVRQAIYTALTSPQLTYQINANAPVTLPIANVIPQSIELAGGAQAPMPLIAIAIEGRGIPSRTVNDRKLGLRIWCVSSTGPDECTELYEAVRARIHASDQDNNSYNMSRPPTGSTLGVVFRECIEERVSPIYFENETQRWYIRAEYRVGAI